MPTVYPSLQQLTRRQFFSRCGVGVGSIALGSLLAPRAGSAGAVPTLADPTLARSPHASPRARNVIYLFMA